MILTLSHGYSSESTHQELSNEYQHDRVSMFFQKSCILVFWTGVAAALEGLNIDCDFLIALGMTLGLYSQLGVLLLFWQQNPCNSHLRTTTLRKRRGIHKNVNFNEIIGKN